MRIDNDGVSLGGITAAYVSQRRPDLAPGAALALLDPTVFDPVLTGESLGQYDPTVPIPAPGVLLQPAALDRFLEKYAPA